jgi:two-component system, NarL family, sensor histidine kinase DesK
MHVSTMQRPTTRSRVWPVTTVVVVVLVGFLFTAGTTGPFTLVLPSLIALSAVAFAVWAVRRSRLNRADYEARLTGWAATEAVLAERLRIARDLHDIVSHGLGLITVRAAATRHLSAGDDPDVDEMRAALDDIETAGRHATGELRRMLTVLRAEDDDAPRGPAEGLAELPGIVSAAGVAGLRTRLTVEDPGEVSQGVQLTVCRTVREALNNAARHAGPTDVGVTVHRDGEAVVVTISDGGPDGAWPAAPGAGHGLTGLRERIAGLGGSFLAEHTTPGFRLVARIPDREAT